MCGWSFFLTENKKGIFISVVCLNWSTLLALFLVFSGFVYIYGQTDPSQSLKNKIYLGKATLFI